MRQAIAEVEARLDDTELERDAREDGGTPVLVGGLATPEDGMVTMKLYGYPANVPRWVETRRCGMP